MRCNLPPPDQFIGKLVDGDFRLDRLIGEGCNALVFHGYSETLKFHAAYKIIPSANLAQGESWAVEAQKANSLGHPCIVNCLGHEDWREREGCVVLKYAFVDGVSLRAYIRQHRDQINVSFIRDFLKTMLELFFEMEQLGLLHGDFHSGNVLVAKPSLYQRNATEQFRVTDFGIGGLTSELVLDDYEQLARILTELLECVSYQGLCPEEKYLFNVLNDHFAAKHLIEKDQTLDPLARNPDKLLTRLEQIDSDYRAAVSKGARPTILTPFDYLSCEQIGQQHSLLHALYSDKFLGISDIEGANNLVVTGPRGCGKSTVFRSLSLKHQLASGTVDLAAKRYFGIYYHCQDLYFKFPRYSVPARDEAIDLPLHYLTARLLIETLDTLNQIAKEDLSVAGQEQNLCRSLWDLLELTRPQLPASDTFATLISSLTKECQWAVEKQRFAAKGDQPIKKPLYGPDRLLEACELIRKTLSLLGGKSFYYFIDDYSTPLISEDLQKNLNRLLMRRNEFCFFKMATESPVSYAPSDIDGKQYVEGREFEELNLGLIYLRGDDCRKLEFLDDIFARRLTAVQAYPASSLVELVGDGETESHNGLAERISNGEKTVWWGRQVLGSMCSGDIHQLITLVGKMVKEVGGSEGLANAMDTPKVKSKIQNRAIRAHAGDFLQSLADSGPHGEKLRKIVTAFGGVAHSYIKFKRSKNEESRPRHQASRIELLEVPVLEGEAKEIYELLLRYSVFIQDPRGKSRRGHPIPRLYLRRFLIPYFNLTFSLRDSLPFEPNEFSDFLLDPMAYENKKRLKQEEMEKDELPANGLQQELDFISEVQNERH